MYVSSSPEHSSVSVSPACFPPCLSQAIFSSLVNILRCCVPPRRRPLSSSFSLWRDLLDPWHFHPPFLLALYHNLLSLFLSFCSPLLPLSYVGKNSGLKSLTVLASSHQGALLNVPEPVLIQPEESFHLPPYTPELSILAMEINSHLSAILKWDFFNSEPKDAENHTLIRIRITESGRNDLRKGISSEQDFYSLNDTTEQREEQRHLGNMGWIYWQHGR